MNVNLIAGFTDCPDNVQGVEAAEEAGERARGEELLLGGSRCAAVIDERPKGPIEKRKRN